MPIRSLFPWFDYRGNERVGGSTRSRSDDEVWFQSATTSTYAGLPEGLPLLTTSGFVHLYLRHTTINVGIVTLAQANSLLIVQ